MVVVQRPGIYWPAERDALKSFFLYVIQEEFTAFPWKYRGMSMTEISAWWSSYPMG